MRRVILAALVAACSVLEPRLLGAQPLPDEISALPVTLDGGVSAHVRVGDVLYVGGEFTGLAPRSRRIGPFGVFAAATADLRAADPSLIGQAVAIVDDGDGGWFVVVGNRIVRLDATGRERPWPAQISGATLADVYALARVGPHLLIGGTFGEFGGQPRGRLAVVDIATAALLPFDAAVVGEAVHVLHVSGDRLYLGGSFTSVAGLPRNHVAQFDLTTGTLLPWAPQVEGTIGVRAIVEAGPRVYVGGTFTTVNGATRLNLATVSVSTGALEPFAPLIFSSRGPSAVRTLAIAGTTLFVGGRFDSVHPASRNGAAAFDLNTEMLLPWAPLATGFVNQISAVTDGILLAGAGLVHSSDPTPRGVLKVSAVTGVPLAWQPAVGGSVAAVWSDGAQVALGGSFSTYHAVPAATSSASTSSTARIRGCRRPTAPCAPWRPTACASSSADRFRRWTDNRAPCWRPSTSTRVTCCPMRPSSSR